MYLCPRCGDQWETAWLAEPTNCATCNPWPCTWGCGRMFPDPRSAHDCCRD